jgi:CRP-like cAMP-binding protein
MAKRTSPPRIQALRGLAAFGSCTRKELDYIDGLGSSVHLRQGAELTRQGTSGRQCAVVEDGAVVVVRDHQVIGVVGPGDWVGELALLDRCPCTATTVTLDEARVIVFTPAEFHAIRNEVPAVDDHVCRQASERRAVLERVAEDPADASGISFRMAAG